MHIKKEIILAPSPTSISFLLIVTVCIREMYADNEVAAVKVPNGNMLRHKTGLILTIRIFFLSGELINIVFRDELNPSQIKLPRDWVCIAMCVGEVFQALDQKRDTQAKNEDILGFLVLFFVFFFKKVI